MTTVISPDREDAIAEAIADLHGQRRSVEIVGGGTQGRTGNQHDVGLVRLPRQ